MTQADIDILPSIEKIEDCGQFKSYSISDDDIRRLFQKRSIPIFETMQLKANYALTKRQLAQFFINKLDKWNKMQEEQVKPNNRTQLALTQFIFSSLKRIALLKQNQIEKHLEDLFQWYKVSSRSHRDRQPAFPRSNIENQIYQVQKSFKTNAPLIISQYWRKPVDIKYSKKTINAQKNQLQELSNNLNQKTIMMQNNFMTDPQVSRRNQFNNKEISMEKIKKKYLQQVYYYSTIQQKNKSINKSRSDKIFEKITLRDKIMQDEVRRHREILEIQQKKQALKNKKARLQFQASKNFYEGSFNTSVRLTKTSEGVRQNKQNIVQQIQKLRIRTGNNLRPKSIANRNLVMPQITQISNIGLLKNPQEIKLKKKKKQKH